MQQTENSSLFERVGRRIADTSPEIHRELTRSGHLENSVYVGLMGAMREDPTAGGSDQELLERAARLAAVSRDEAVQATSPVQRLREALKASSPEMFSSLERAGVLDRVIHDALVSSIRELGAAAASDEDVIELAKNHAAQLRDPSVRRMLEADGVFSSDAGRWKQEAADYMRRSGPERFKTLEANGELPFFVDAVFASGREAQACAERGGLPAGAAQMDAKLALLDAIGRPIEGPDRITQRAEAYEPISFLEFRQLRTWLQWGDVGGVGEATLSKLLSMVAQKPEMAKLVRHPLFDAEDADGGVLRAAILGAQSFGQGDLEGALVHFRHAAGRRPSSLFAVCVANSLRALARDREAAEYLEGAMRQWPGDNGLRLMAAGVAFSSGDIAKANKLFAPMKEGYFSRYRTDAHVARRQRELDEAIAEHRLYRKAESDIYDDSYAESTWWNYWFHFNAYTQNQHGEGILGEVAPELLKRFLRSGRVKAKTCVEVGTMCGELLYRAARDVPETRFIGVDRNPVLKVLNDRAYSLPNLEFRADDVLNVLEEEGVDFNDAVLFHTRTSPFLLPDFMRQLYGRCRQKGFGAITLLETYPLSIKYERFQSFEEMPEISEVRGGGLLTHNYPKILREAGFPNVEFEFVKPTMLFAGVDSSVFLHGTLR